MWQKASYTAKEAREITKNHKPTFAERILFKFEKIWRFFRFDLLFGLRNLWLFFGAAWQWREWDYAHDLIVFERIVELRQTVWKKAYMTPQSEEKIDKYLASLDGAIKRILEDDFAAPSDEDEAWGELGELIKKDYRILWD